MLFANEDLLKLVWLNLIDNARKFAYDKTSLVIKIEDSADETTVSISDRGEVIEKKEIEKIFSKFYQAGQKKEGNGIGLKITTELKKLIEQSINEGEKMQIELTPTAGNEFFYQKAGFKYKPEKITGMYLWIEK